MTTDAVNDAKELNDPSFQSSQEGENASIGIALSDSAKPSDSFVQDVVRSHGLRGSETELALRNLEASLSKEISALKTPTEVLKLSIEERATFMEQVKTSMNDVVQYWQNIDWGDLSQYDDSDRTAAFMESTLESVESAVELVRQAATEGGPALKSKVKSNHSAAVLRRKRTKDKTTICRQHLP